MTGARALGILGAGGHGRVAADAWTSRGGSVFGFYDDNPDLAVLGSIQEGLSSLNALHIAVGSNDTRRRIAAHVPDSNCPPIVHCSAVASGSAEISAGVLICANAVVQPNARVGRHTIINTAAVVEHDCLIGDFVHIAPGVRLAGDVTIGQGAMIGIGAVVIPGISIFEGAMVGAGAVVIRDVPAGAVVAGNPARSLRGPS